MSLKPPMLSVRVLNVSLSFSVAHDMRLFAEVFVDASEAVRLVVLPHKPAQRRATDDVLRRFIIDDWDFVMRETLRTRAIVIFFVMYTKHGSTMSSADVVDLKSMKGRNGVPLTTRSVS
ncbi:unnamed protein product [Phytophthora fragariaefolia]|uniref:Unnamed protein product n=1 Tax=Phytophthora fragariaefolia TaxID=1490495 RepID=A0A9W6Y265_9STRA|nr:unnamed protein product [Phytophthora fragariaefolia]